MFLFAFILPSFTISQEVSEKEKVIHKTSNDSLLIQFSNPTVDVTVKDARLEQNTGPQNITMKELIGEFKKFNEAIATYNANRERRWSVMDRIEAETGYKPVQVSKFIDQKRKLYRWYAALAIIYMAGVVTIYGKDFRRLKSLIIFPMFVWSVLVGTLCIYISLFYRTSETYQFWELLKHLSP